MQWVDEKLAESGEPLEDNESSSIKRVLSEILEEPDFEESYTMDRKKDSEDKENAESEVELLAV